MMRYLVWSLALAFVACDMPVDPVPSNPFDSEFDGKRRPSTPLNVRLASMTPTSVTLAWEDVSSFEDAFRVERSLSYQGTYYPVASFPADAAGGTIQDIDWGDVGFIHLRVIAVTEGEGESPPSEPVYIEPPD